MAFPIALTGGSKCSPIVSFRQGKASGGEAAVARALPREAAEGALAVYDGSRHREAGVSLGAAARLRCKGGFVSLDVSRKREPGAEGVLLRG